jgi:hypothetical protein
MYLLEVSLLLMIEILTVIRQELYGLSFVIIINELLYMFGYNVKQNIKQMLQVIFHPFLKTTFFLSFYNIELVLNL